MIKKKFSHNATILKIFLSFTFLSALIAVFLFLLSFLGIIAISSDSDNIYPHNPRYYLELISKNLVINKDASSDGKTEIFLQDESILPQDFWCILLDENGDTIWSLHKPDDIPAHYSLNDVARMTKWFLNDYPVYVRTEDYGLLVVGRPKFSVGKYDMEYSMSWFDSLPLKLLVVFLLNFALASLFFCCFGSFLYKKIKLLTEGLSKLQQEEIVSLPTRGIFKEPFLNINKTSEILARKNALLASRDKARSNWVSGISHDIRTPLSMVIGYGEQLSENPELSEKNQKYAAIITAQGLKIKKLIEDLNLISSLEYDMQPVDKKPLYICVLLRSVVSELLNQMPLQPEQVSSAVSDIPPTSLWAGRHEIILDLHCEQAVVLADEALLSRAFFNLLQNSILHNENGCQIHISGSLSINSVQIIISDNGRGCPENVLKNPDTLPNTTHGIGLPMACKIIRAHGGSFRAENKNGFTVSIELPRA